MVSESFPNLQLFPLQATWFAACLAWMFSCSILGNLFLSGWRYHLVYFQKMVFAGDVALFIESWSGKPCLHDVSSQSYSDRIIEWKSNEESGLQLVGCRFCSSARFNGEIYNWHHLFEVLLQSGSVGWSSYITQGLQLNLYILDISWALSFQHSVPDLLGVKFRGWNPHWV